MKWEDFKNKFKQDVQQQPAEVDVDSIWNAIESDVDAINNKRKRRYFFWMFFTGILLVGGIGSYALFYKNIGLATNAENVSKTIYEKQRNTQVVDNQELVVESRSAGLSEANLEVKQKNVNNFSKKEKIENEKVEWKFNEKIKNNTFTNEKQNPKIDDSENDFVEKTIHLQDEINESDSNIASVGIEKTTSIKAPKENAKLELHTLPLYFSLVNFPIFEKEIQNVLDKNKSDKYLEEIKKEWDAKNRKKKNKLIFSTEVFAGASLINRKLESNDPSVNELLQIRKNNEYPLEASHMGFLFKVKNKKGFHVSLGIQKTAIAERYEYNNTLTIVDSIMEVKSLLVQLTGDTIQKMGMIPRTTSSVFEKKIFNTYELLDIPVFIGYEKVKGNWHLGVEAGILANISLQTEGIIPNETFEDINIETQQDEIFKSKIGLSYHLGLTVSREFLGVWRISLAPSLRIIPSNFAKAEYGLSQNYTLYGARVGVSYLF